MKMPFIRFISLTLAATFITPAGLSRINPANQSAGDHSEIKINEVMQRVSERVRKYYEDLFNVTSTEKVQRQNLKSDLSPDGKPKEMIYDFALFRKKDAKDNYENAVTEVRDLKSVDGKPAKKNDRPQCIDSKSAYTGLLRFLLPEGSRDYTFKLAGEENLEGRKVWIIEYDPIRKENPEIKWQGKCFSVSGIAKKGKIWVDFSTYDVIQIRAEQAEPFQFKSPRVYRTGIFLRLGPRRDLKFNRSDIVLRFKRVEFHGPDQSLILPDKVETFVVIEGAGVPAYKTSHVFSDYKRFIGEIRMVDSESIK